MPVISAVLLAVTLGFGTPATAVPDVMPVGTWPLQPGPAEVVRGFDPPDSPYGSGHRGVDLLGVPGQGVHAALPGTVTYAGSLAGRGVVVVDHGATRTTYEPVAATVSVGTSVPAGAVMGTLEVPSSHCFPRACLHWGWIEGETYLDPLLLVGVGPVRLLPLWREEPVGYLMSRTGSPPMLASHVVMSDSDPPLVNVTATENQQPPRVAGSQL